MFARKQKKRLQKCRVREFTCFFAGYLSLVRRIKAKSLWENSLLRSFGIFIGKILRDMKLTKKTAGLLILYFLFQLFVLWGGNFFLVIADEL